MTLSEDARKELRDAIAIVREDKFELYARDTLLRHTAKPEKEDPEGVPPRKDEPNDPPKTRKTGYWGELMDDDE